MTNRIWAALLSSALLSNVSWGATHLIRPDGSGDYPSIQAGLDASVPGDTVELANGTFTGAGNRDLDFHGKQLVLRSRSGIPDSCVIDCQGTQTNYHRGIYFHTNEDSNTVVSGLGIVNGAAQEGGGIYCDNASPTIVSCAFVQNWAEAGSAMACYHSGRRTIAGCTFRYNTGDYGAVALWDFDGTMRDCTFDGNRGVGLLLSLGNFSVTSCVFIGNIYGAGGGSGAADIAAAALFQDVSSVTTSAISAELSFPPATS